MTDKHLSRRNLLAAGASAAVSGAVADPVAGPSAVETAIVRHVTAYANFLRAVAENAGDEECKRLGSLEFAALREVALASARTDAELLRKITYCFKHERDSWGLTPDTSEEFGTVALALEQHLGGNS